MLGTILLIVGSAFLLGGLARWAIPGPDPMPVWLTILFGFAGSLIGGGITAALLGANENVGEADYFTIAMAQILATMALVIAYRRLYQRRPLTGPEAKLPPTRGIGIGSGRAARLKAADKRELLRRIDELHDAGLLTEDEYVAKRREVLSREPA